ncbi:type 1 glutamine amidotransferase (plasmid) [Rhizobium sp. CB3060]|uniref:type 1 glutamine amidotransferase n=1 Tax=Rhizobium sp. CB3060 TaxID=3138255 RepID=UPI0021A7AE0E|nr:type 1 glutamine amidotransferase [Rhizobium tropici]UWU25537.1 type 1 glutamine amidotransferase [Rhizobium tropici]
MPKILVGILKTGSAPAELAAAQGDYDAAFRQLLGDDDFEFETYDIENNVFPGSPASADAWLITGSRHGVYEDHSWIAPLEALIRDIRDSRIPLVGIYFGHQIIAQALGGKVERATAGWIAGPQRYRDAGGTEFVMNAWHRDQVVQTPPDAEVFATGENCPLAALRYGGGILTYQGHPEFDRDYFQGLVRERGGVLEPDMRDEVMERASRSILDQAHVVAGLKRILKYWSEGAPAG